MEKGKSFLTLTEIEDTFYFIFHTFLEVYLLGEKLGVRVKLSEEEWPDVQEHRVKLHARQD